jgi:hypothetical protein
LFSSLLEPLKFFGKIRFLKVGILWGFFFFFFGITFLLLKTNTGAKLLDSIYLIKLQLQQALERLELGLDFRPRKAPLPLLGTLEKTILVLGSLIFLGLMYQPSLPVFLGTYFLPFSALLYLLTLSLVWGGTFAFILLLLFTGLPLLWDYFFAQSSKQNRYKAVSLLLLGFLSILWVLNRYVSPALTLAGVSLLAVFPVFILQGQEQERPYLLYGLKDRKPLKSLALIQWVKSYLILSALGVMFWGILLLGEYSVELSPSTTRYETTYFMGKLFLWLWSVQRFYLLYNLYYWKKQAPQASRPKSLWIYKKSKPLPPSLIQKFREKSWKILYHRREPHLDEADFQLGFPSASSGVPSLALKEEEWGHPSVFFKIERQEHLYKKRQFLRGMKKLFKIGSAKRK